MGIQESTLHWLKPLIQQRRLQLNTLAVHSALGAILKAWDAMPSPSQGEAAFNRWFVEVLYPAIRAGRRVHKE